MIGFISTRILVDATASTTINVTLSKNSVSTKSSSVNILLSGADILYPSAQQYQGIKQQVIWLAGETGQKIVSIAIEPTSNIQEYLLATLDDIVGDTIDAISRAYILVSKNVSDPSIGNFLSPVSSNYVNVITIAPTGVSSAYVNELTLGATIPTFTPNVLAMPGQAAVTGTGGIIPPAPLISDPQIFTDQGWNSSPSVITAPANDRSNTVANTEFVQTAIDAAATDLSANFTPNTVAADGMPGIVPAPPAGTNPEVLTNNGWSTSPQVVTRPAADNGLNAANTAFVQQELQSLDNKLAATFTPNTDTLIGISGQVPAPPISTDPLILTNNGWSSSPKVITPLNTGGDGLNVANTKYVTDSLSVLDTKFTDITAPFTSNSPTTSGTPGTIPAPPASTDPLILTGTGWSSDPQVKTAAITDSDQSLANTSFVQQLITAVQGKLDSAITNFNLGILTLTSSIAGLTSQAQQFATSLSNDETSIAAIIANAKTRLLVDTTFYVDPVAGIDSQNTKGTQSTPFLTPQYAINWIKSNIEQAGTTITLKLGHGTYSQIDYSVDNSDIILLIGVENWIIEGDVANPSAVVFNVSKLARYSYGIALFNTTAIRIRGIQLNGNPTSAGIVMVQNPLGNISNCILSNGLSGIHLYSSRIAINDNAFNGDYGSNGVPLVASDYSVLIIQANNTINASNCLTLIEVDGSRLEFENPILGSCPSSVPKYRVIYSGIGFNIIQNTSGVTGGNGFVDAATFAYAN